MRRLLLGLAVTIAAASPAKLVAQRIYHDDYYRRIDYGVLHDRIRASVDRALERSTRTIERSTRLSTRAAERASRAAERTAERTALRVRNGVDARRSFDSDAFDRRMDRLRDRLDSRMRTRLRDRRWRW
jgi:hypothetical protein